MSQLDQRLLVSAPYLLLTGGQGQERLRASLPATLNMSWKNALVDYAKTVTPANLPDNVLLMHTKQTLTIWDKYPKAAFQYASM